MGYPKTKMRPHEAARYLGVSKSGLAKWRCNGAGPPYMKLSERIVLYDQSELDGWLSARSRLSTSAPSKGAT